MSILSIIATTTGIIMAIGNIPQGIKIFKRKSAKDVSLITFATVELGSIFWFAYGLEIHDLPIIIANGVGIFAVSIVLIGWFLYR